MPINLLNSDGFETPERSKEAGPCANSLLRGV